MTKKKKYKPKKFLKLCLSLFLVFIIFAFSTSFYNYDNLPKYSDIKSKLKNILSAEKKAKDEEKKYNDCILLGITDDNLSDETISLKNDILSYAKSKKLRFSYENLQYNDVILYNENSQIYGASLIKLLTAIYLLDNDIDLNTTIKYESKYKSAYSEFMDKRKVGEMVSLKDLMTYSISASDNTAHHMIISYIGKGKLRSYAESLGASNVLKCGDDYCEQTSNNMRIYLKKAYELINTKENGYVLKEAMFNTKKNSLNVDNLVTYAHKYGSHENYYHDTGINFDIHPYTIAVLTESGYSNGSKYINEISKLVKNYNDSYYNDLENYCRKKD